MTAPRGMSLLVQPDQWARCAHTNTALLADGGVELTWDDPTVADPERVCGTECADPGGCEHRSGAAVAGSWPAPSGLAFDRWCRAYRSRPAGVAVDCRDRLYIAETGASAVHVVDLGTERVLRKVPLRAAGRWTSRPTAVAPSCLPTSRGWSW